MATLPATPTYDINALLKQYVPAAPSAAALDRIAQRKAQDSTNEQIGVYRRAEQNDLQQAAMRAQQINAATLASAGYLDHLGFGERLRSAFQQAGQDQAQIAQGFSGDLRNTAGAAAARVQANLAHLGAPGSGPGGVNDGSQAANVVYGLGAIPANVLTASAPLALARAQAYPAQLIGAGQAEAVGAIGAGQQAAARYQPEIANAVAKMPALEQTYLTQLTSAAGKARQDALDNFWKAIKFQQAGDTSAATKAWREAQLSATDAHNKATEAAAIERNNISDYNSTTSRMNANTSRYSATTARIKANKPDAPKMYQDVYGRQIEILPDGTQRAISAGQFKDPTSGVVYQVNPDGSRAALTKPKSTAAAKTAITPTTRAKVATKAKQFYEGVAPEKQYVPARYDSSGNELVAPHWVPVPGTGTPPLPYPQAFAQLMLLGPSTKAWARYVQRTLDSFYGEGEGGRPLSPATQKGAETGSAAVGAGANALNGFFFGGPGGG